MPARRSFHLLTILGIPVEINYTWFIVFGLVIWTLARGYFPMVTPGLTAVHYWTMGFIAALLLFISLLLHELSHSYVAKLNNLPIKGISLFIFGGVAHMEKEPADPGVEFKMAVAGPALSFFLALLFLLITNLLKNIGSSPEIVAVTNYLFIVNLVIGIFNLIPGFPLDGGRVFRAGLWTITNDLKRATLIASTFGKGFAYILMALGFVYLFMGYILNGVWFIFIGLFLQDAAEMSYQQLVMRKALTGVKIRSIMARSVITVPSSTTVSEVVDNYFFKYRHTGFPVISEENLLGVITLDNVKELPKEKWPMTLITQVMTPIREDMIIHPEADVFEALTQMARSGSGRLLIVEGGELIGIVAQRDIIRLFELRADLGKA